MECKCKPAKSYAERIIEYKEFVSLVNRMRATQKDVIYKSKFSSLDSARLMAYEAAKMTQIVLEDF